MELLQLAQRHREYVKQSRIGPVIDLGPTVIELSNKDIFRMPLLKKRNFNPFFALAEYSWFIEGSELLQPLQYFLQHYDKYSDDGLTLNGAYGFRLRHAGIDQIELAINELKQDPICRRVVLNLYNIHQDLGSKSKDVPCNTSIMLKVRDNALDMTVINRSNDLFLGVPYNVFLFFLFQCYLAKRLSVNVGYQRHFTDSLHLYTDKLPRVDEIVSANTVENIKQIQEKFLPVDISEYVLVEHDLVIQQRFSELNNPLFRNFFNVFIRFRDAGLQEDITNELPNNQLDYMAYLWLTEKNQNTGTNKTSISN